MRGFGSLLRNQSGAALIELAIVLPITLTLFFGGFEVTRVVSANTRVSNAAQTLADLVSQQTSVNSTSIGNFCTGAQLVMTPFSGTPLSAAIVSVTNEGGAPFVDWQDTTCGNATAISNATALAASLVPNAGDSVIVVKTIYGYTSPISYVLSAHYTLSQIAYARPQQNSSVTHD